MQETGLLSAAQVGAVVQAAMRDGITHLHLCVLHHKSGERRLAVEPARKAYAGWLRPLPDVANTSPR